TTATATRTNPETSPGILILLPHLERDSGGRCLASGAATGIYEWAHAGFQAQMTKRFVISGLRSTMTSSCNSGGGVQATARTPQRQRGRETRGGDLRITTSKRSR